MKSEKIRLQMEAVKKNQKIGKLVELAGKHKKKTAALAVVLLAVVIFGGRGLTGGGRSGEGGRAGGPGGMPGGGSGGARMDNVATVAAEKPETGSVERFSSTAGTIEASDVVYIYAKAAGDVTSVDVQVGDEVTEGQLLCTIDTEQVESAKNSMDSAAVNYEEAQKTMERMSLLYQGGDLSDQEWEQYQNNAKTAKLQYESAKLTYEKQVKYSMITASISGKVETCDIEVYDHVNQSAQLCVIAGEGEKRVSFYVTERVVGNLSQGDKVTVIKSGTEYEGTITDVSTMAEESNGLFKVKAQLPEANAIAAGTAVKVSVVSAEAENVMTVPVDAIYYDGGVGNVYVYEDGTVHKLEVEVGIYDSERAEIKAGLTGDELVISSWSSQLYEGSTVMLKGSSESSETEAAGPENSAGEPAEAGKSGQQ